MDGKLSRTIWISVFILLVGFIAGAVTLVMLRPIPPAQGPTLASCASNSVELVEASAYDAFLEPPLQIDASEKRMLTSEVRISCMHCGKMIPVSCDDCPFCYLYNEGLPDFDSDGIPDKTEKHVGMDPRDPDDIYEDMDGDSFTNGEEYDRMNDRWFSDPGNPTLTPPEIIKLRLWKYKNVERSLKCEPILDEAGSEKFIITFDSKTQVLSAGEEFKNGPHCLFRFINYEPKSDVTEKDVIIVGVVFEGGEESMRIAVNTPPKSDPKALLVNLNTSRRITAVPGAVFKVDGQTYRIEAIERNNVAVIEVESGEAFNIGRISSIEEDRLLGSTGKK